MRPKHHNGVGYYISADKASGRKSLCIQGNHAGFQGKLQKGVYQGPLSPENAAALRPRLPWLQPEPLGLATSFGFGDRLGLATTGHIAAVNGTGIAPIFAQQSVRENTRTGRSPQQVLDDAMWAIFEADWRAPWGADADHVKEISDLPPFIRAGYTFYTIDPSQHVDDQANDDSVEKLKRKVRDLPWDVLGITLDDLRHLYVQSPTQLEGADLEFGEETLLRGMAKYGRALAHIKSVSDYLVGSLGSFDLEVSIDETDTPTSVQEHYLIASELRRLGVPFISLAPRFIGRFEKGVDYVGDIAAFKRELEKHAAVIHAIGGYKLSIHTGSDKFSLYPGIARHARNLAHVKTAGTSYLEALRVIATAEKPFFREILDFSRSHYETDRATYHVSAQMENVPSSGILGDDELTALFEQFDARQALHVTYGSVLDEYGSQLKDTLRQNLDLYDQYLTEHFKRHLEPFQK